MYKYLIFLISLISLSCSASQKEEQKLIPRALLFGNPSKTSPLLSPDSRQIAYLAPDKDNVLNVFVQEMSQPNQPPRQVTHDTKRGIRSFFWQEDSRHILYIQDQGGDENWHLYQTSIDQETTRDMTPYDGSRVDILSYQPSRPDELLLQMNRRNKDVFDVYRLSLETGALDLDTENPGDVYQWIADNEGHIRASQSYSPDGSLLVRTRDNNSSPWQSFITIASDDSTAEVVGFSEDGRSLSILSGEDEDTNTLYQIDLLTKKKTSIAHDDHFDISGVLVHPTTHKIEAAHIENETQKWILLDTSLERDFHTLRNHFHQDTFSIISRDRQDTHWIIAYHSDRHPVHFYLYDRSSHHLSLLFSAQPALEDYTMATMQPITYQARDGMTLHGYLTMPLQATNTRPPMILMVHGGPWARDSWGFNPFAQWLANRGFSVLQINFRGSTGYGKRYLNAGNKEWAGKMHQDLLDGKEWAISHHYADPSRIAIFGGSYGGYATLVALTFTPEAFTCGIDVVGPSNLITLLQSIPPYWSTVMSQFIQRVGDPQTEQEKLIACSPLFKASSITKPLLIAQGANDPRVKQAESDQIVSVMRSNKLAVDYLLFPDEGHGFARPQNRLRFIAAMEAFLAKHMGSLCEAPSDEESWVAFEK